VNRPLRLLALGTAAALTIAAAPGPTPRKANWNAIFTLTPGGGHMLGNPAAPVRLTQYVSYTCSHCAQFEMQADAPLKGVYVPSGRVSVEVRHFLRDPIDLTAAMLTNCGAKERFFLNHAAIMRSQKVWLAIVGRATQVQRGRWTSGTLIQRNQAIASDLGFYRIMSTRGYDRPTLDRCLADQALAQRLAEQAEAARKLEIDGTPAFTINGTLLIGTHEWATLRPQLDARL
jgi:protein-disulfide isomerase